MTEMWTKTDLFTWKGTLPNGLVVTVQSTEMPTRPPTSVAVQCGFSIRPRYAEGCETCEGYKERGLTTHESHYASPRCQSGHRNHCTCDTCF